jgi:hypothetical protein
VFLRGLRGVDLFKAYYISSGASTVRIKERVYLVSGSFLVKWRPEGCNCRAAAAFIQDHISYLAEH